MYIAESVFRNSTSKVKDLYEKKKVNEYLLFPREVVEKLNIISQEIYKTNWQVLLQQVTLVFQGIFNHK